jgi:hypothetical protein
MKLSKKGRELFGGFGGCENVGGIQLAQNRYAPCERSNEHSISIKKVKAIPVTGRGGR